MKKAIFAFVFRILGFGASLAGIIIHSIFNMQDNGSFMANHSLAYFTLQTNIFVFIIFAILLVKTIVLWIKNKKLEVATFYPSLVLACTYYITITMIVYWIVLCPIVGMNYKNPNLIASNIMLHTITPLFAIVDSILFFKHGSVKKIDALKWLAYPLLYLISIIIIANVPNQQPYYFLPLGGKTIALMYPYPFLDPQVVGIGGMIGVIFALVAIFTAFGFAYIAIDNAIAKSLKKKSNKT